MAMWPFNGGLALTARSCGCLVLASCLTLAVAERVVVPEDSPSLGKSLRWGSLATAAALAVQLAVLKRASEGVPEGEKNSDPTLTWREDEGISKLAPVVPEPKGAEGKKKLAKFTMAEVAAHNTRTDLWIIVDERVYDVTRYVDKHPGGFLPMVDMAGKDCTDVFANYHAARVYRHMLPAYLVGECTDVKVPEHVKDFRAIRQELLRRGLFETDMRFYAKMATWLAFLWIFALWLTLGCNSVSAHMVGATVMGIFWQQLAGIGHDLGHSGVTHVFWVDHMIGSACAALMGISTCWWKRNHNTHHVACNSVEHDPDIQHMPLFAVTAKIFEKPYWSTYYTKWVSMDAVAKFLVSYQHIFFYPIMMLARFNLYAQSWIQLLSPEPLHYRKLEMCSLLTYASWVIAVALSLPSWGQTVSWLLLSHAVGGILHVQIVISHWAMHTYHGHAYNDEKDEWYITQMKTTMNVATPPMLDWVHIGLQFQIEHHLYPRLPRHNLRQARELVQAVCKKHNIPYVEPGFFEANYLTVKAMYAAACQAKTAKQGESGFYESALWDGLKLTG